MWFAHKNPVMTVRTVLSKKKRPVSKQKKTNTDESFNSAPEMHEGRPGNRTPLQFRSSPGRPRHETCTPVTPKNSEKKGRSRTLPGAPYRFMLSNFVEWFLNVTGAGAVNTLHNVVVDKALNKGHAAQNRNSTARRAVLLSFFPFSNARSTKGVATFPKRTSVLDRIRANQAFELVGESNKTTERVCFKRRGNRTFLNPKKIMNRQLRC